MIRSSFVRPVLALLLALGTVAGCKDARAPVPAGHADQAERTALRQPDDGPFVAGAFALAVARLSGKPVPLLVLRGQNPWAMVVGADSTGFVLYEGGRVIYREREGYRTALLNPAQVRALWNDVRPSALVGLAGRYAVSDFTDEPETDLLVFDTRPFGVSIYGSLDAAEARSRLPASVLHAADRLRSFRVQGARPWLPERIEVMIWPYEYAPQPSLAWPAGWPTWKDPGAVKRGDGYSLYLPLSAFASLTSLLDRLPDKAAVAIAGRKWAVSYRLPFPREELWIRRGAD